MSWWYLQGMQTDVPRYSRLMLMAVLATGLAGCAALATLTTHRVKVEASHAAGALKVLETWPVVGDLSETYRLEAIHGTGLLGRVDRLGRTASAVTLKTDRGEVPLSRIYETTGRDAQKHALDAFLADPSAQPLGMVYDRGNPLAFLALPAVVVLVLGVRVMWVRKG